VRIGLVSDTHIQDDLAGMPDELAATFKAQAVDLILHMGDVNSPRVLDVLEQVATVVAVRDFAELPSADPRLDQTRRVIEVAGRRIGMVHDIGWPGPNILAHQELRFPSEPLEEVLVLKFGQPVDIVAFGHTHEELLLQHQGVWFINPGSPTYPGLRHAAGGLGTIGILDIDPRGPVTARILKLCPTAKPGQTET